MNIYAALFLFFGLYLSVCIWIFLIITDSIRKISTRSLLRSKPDFVREVDRQFMMLTEESLVPENEIISLCREMTNRKMKRYYLQRFIYFADRIPDKKIIKEYFRTAYPFFLYILQLGRSIHYSEESYRIMILGEFRQDLPEINEFILAAIENESFDVITNALRALSVIGNCHFFNEGLKKVCKSENYFNSRHIAEMMGSFEGNIEELTHLMMNSFYSMPDNYRFHVIVFLAEYKCCNSINFVLNFLLDNPAEKEVLIACLRYFRACEPNEKAWPFILKMLNQDDVEIMAVAVTLTPVYFKSDQDILGIISGERYLKSRDWYVRKNSAQALAQFGMEKEELIRYFDIDDKYAKEALAYAMLDAGIITYQEFVELGGGLSGNSN